MTLRTILLLIASLILLFGCKSTEETTREGDSGEPVFNAEGEIAEEYLMEELTELERTLYRTRSDLSDRYASVGQDIPDIFLKQVVEREEEVNPYAGFRVQILSTRNVAEADSTRNQFRLWATSKFGNYTPEAYVLFRQPYYRVRVGDFQNRERAISFSRLIKNRFPEAWVVHDRINPQDVPADSIRIEFSLSESTGKSALPDTTRQE